MPVLKRTHWEIAAVARANGATQQEAYEGMGLKYNAGAASRFFSRPDIAGRIEEIQAEREEVRRQAANRAVKHEAMDRAFVLQYLRGTVASAMRGDPVYKRNGDPLLDANGNQVYRPDRQSALRGLHLIGQDIGMFVQRTEVGGPGDFARMTDEELNAKLVEMALQLGLPEPAVKAIEDLSKREDEEVE